MLEINKNMGIYSVEAEQMKFDDIKKIFLNKDNKMFYSYSSSSTPEIVYKEGKKYNFELTDEQIDKIAEQIDLNENSNQVVITNISGMLSKIVFYQITSSEEKTVPFTIEFEYKYSFE